MCVASMVGMWGVGHIRDPCTGLGHAVGSGVHRLFTACHDGRVRWGWSGAVTALGGSLSHSSDVTFSIT